MDDITLGGIGSTSTAVVALFALAVSIYSAFISTRSASAAEKSADATQRSAEADEEMVRLAKAGADRLEVPWHLIKEGKRYRLMNNSDEDAVNVEIHGDVMTPDFKNGGMIPARSAIRVLDTPSMGSSEPLSVTWYRPGEGRRLGPWTDAL